MKKNTSAAALAPYGIYKGCGLEFESRGYNPYTFDGEYIRDCYGGVHTGLLESILLGYTDVTVLPWEPKHGDDYWYFDYDGDPRSDVWEGDVEDYTYHKSGNFARTETELLSRKVEIMREIGMTE